MQLVMELIIALQRIGRIVAMAREEMLSSVRAGVTTAELGRIGKRVLDEHGAISAPIITYGFPGTTCISVMGGGSSFKLIFEISGETSGK